MRSKTQSLPFNLLDIADTDTVDYNDDTNLEDPNMNKNAILVAKKISDKYRTICRKRKTARNPEPIESERKRPKTSSLSSKSARTAEKKSVKNIKNYVMGDKKVFKKAKNVFNNLNTDPASVIFAEEFLEDRLLKN